jgi:DNA polymerase III subunit chi
MADDVLEGMTEIRFYHLERRKLEDALPALLEEALTGGARVVVEATSPELVDALDERLWTYSDDSFLPHGTARDGEPDAQPVYLTSGRENPNGAVWRVLVGGARALPALTEGGYERIALIFDGDDPDARAAAREQWAEIKAAGHTLTYWRQDDAGRWSQGR